MSGISLDELVDIQITDGTDTLAINADGSIDVNFAAGAAVEITDGTDTLAVNGDGSINAVVSATDLDIRDLDHTQDDVRLGDGTSLINFQTLDSAHNDTAVVVGIAGVRQDASGSPVSNDGDAHPLVFNSDGELRVAADLTSDIADDAADSGNPIKMGGRAADGVLTALDDGDRYDLLGDLYRRTWVNDSANIGINTESANVTSTVAEVLSTPLAGRRFVTIQNRGSAAVFLVESGATAVSEGIAIPANSSATFNFGEDINIFLGTASGTATVRLLEAG